MNSIGKVMLRILDVYDGWVGRKYIDQIRNNVLDVPVTNDTNNNPIYSTTDATP